MKTMTNKIPLVLFAIIVFQGRLFADAETNAPYHKLGSTSSNVADVVKFLPDAEKLWPQNPDAYLITVNQAARVLDGNLNDSNTKQKFYSLFASVMQKTCPTNEAQATSWIRLKREVLGFYVVHDEVKNDKVQWLAVASFLGEIRSKKIQDYRNQAVNVSGIANSPYEQAAQQKGIEENERNKITDNFQSEIWQAESSLMFLMQYVCPFTQKGQPADTNFVNNVVAAARLTDNERKRFFGK